MKEYLLTMLILATASHVVPPPEVYDRHVVVGMIVGMPVIVRIVRGDGSIGHSLQFLVETTWRSHLVIANDKMADCWAQYIVSSGPDSTVDLEIAVRRGYVELIKCP